MSVSGAIHECTVERARGGSEPSAISESDQPCAYSSLTRRRSAGPDRELREARTGAGSSLFIFGIHVLYHRRGGEKCTFVP